MVTFRQRIDRAKRASTRFTGSAGYKSGSEDARAYSQESSRSRSVTFTDASGKTVSVPLNGRSVAQVIAERNQNMRAARAVAQQKKIEAEARKAVGPVRRVISRGNQKVFIGISGKRYAVANLPKVERQKIARQQRAQAEPVTPFQKLAQRRLKELEEGEVLKKASVTQKVMGAPATQASVTQKVMGAPATQASVTQKLKLTEKQRQQLQGVKLLGIARKKLTPAQEKVAIEKIDKSFKEKQPLHYALYTGRKKFEKNLAQQKKDANDVLRYIDRKRASGQKTTAREEQAYFRAALSRTTLDVLDGFTFARRPVSALVGVARLGAEPSKLAKEVGEAFARDPVAVVFSFLGASAFFGALEKVSGGSSTKGITFKKGKGRVTQGKGSATVKSNVGIYKRRNKVGTLEVESKISKGGNVRNRVQVIKKSGRTVLQKTRQTKFVRQKARASAEAQAREIAKKLRDIKERLKPKIKKTKVGKTKAKLTVQNELKGILSRDVKALELKLKNLGYGAKTIKRGFLERSITRTIKQAAKRPKKPPLKLRVEISRRNQIRLKRFKKNVKGVVRIGKDKVIVTYDKFVAKFSPMIKTPLREIRLPLEDLRREIAIVGRGSSRALIKKIKALRNKGVTIVRKAKSTVSKAAKKSLKAVESSVKKPFQKLGYELKLDLKTVRFLGSLKINPIRAALRDVLKALKKSGGSVNKKVNAFIRRLDKKLPVKIRLIRKTERAPLIKQSGRAIRKAGRRAYRAISDKDLVRAYERGKIAINEVPQRLRTSAIKARQNFVIKALRLAASGKANAPIRKYLGKLLKAGKESRTLAKAIRFGRRFTTRERLLFQKWAIRKLPFNKLPSSLRKALRKRFRAAKTRTPAAGSKPPMPKVKKTIASASKKISKIGREKNVNAGRKNAVLIMKELEKVEKAAKSAKRSATAKSAKQPKGSARPTGGNQQLLLVEKSIKKTKEAARAIAKKKTPKAIKAATKTKVSALRKVFGSKLTKTFSKVINLEVIALGSLAQIFGRQRIRQNSLSKTRTSQSTGARLDQSQSQISEQEQQQEQQQGQGQEIINITNQTLGGLTAAATITYIISTLQSLGGSNFLRGLPSPPTTQASLKNALPIYKRAFRRFLKQFYFTYSPSLFSLAFGVRATRGQAQKLLARGRTFTGLETRPVVR